MHFWANSKNGATLFSPLNDLVESLSSEERRVWDSLYFLSGSGRETLAQPLIYPHPVTGKPTMCFHCGE